MQTKLMVGVTPAQQFHASIMHHANEALKGVYRATQFIRYEYPGFTRFAEPHISLRFSSRLPLEEMTDYISRVEEVARDYKTFTLDLNGSRTFDKDGQPCVWYWHVEPHQVLQQIHDDLRQALNRWETSYFQTYKPHMTMVVDERNPAPLHAIALPELPHIRLPIKELTILKVTAERKPRSYQRAYVKTPLGE